jgi:hypothetical protein
MPLFATLLESRRKAPEQWAQVDPVATVAGAFASGGGGTEGARSSAAASVVRLDGGLDGLKVLWPSRTTHFVSASLGLDAGGLNGTDGGFQALYKEVFGVPTANQEDGDASSGAPLCGRTVVIGAFDHLFPIHFRKLWVPGVVYNPGYLSMAREFRAAVLRLHGVDPTVPALERRRRSSVAATKSTTTPPPPPISQLRPLRVALVDRSASASRKPAVCASEPDREVLCTRAVGNLAEVAAYLRAHALPGEFEVVIMDLGEGSSLRANVEAFAGFDILVGSEGAAFTNLLWLPLDAGMLVLHGKIRGKVFHWFTALAQYFGHSVLNVVLSRHDRVHPPRVLGTLRTLASRMAAVEGRGPGAAFSHCLTTDQPGDANPSCPWQGDTCLASTNPKKRGNTVGSTALCSTTTIAAR